MSWRAIILGFALGLFISGFCYFNDQVIRQTFLVGNHLPISVFGFLIIIVLAINPLLRRIRPALAFRPLEMAVIIAVGLAACGWPGSSFFRYFSPLTVMPGVLVNNQSGWKQSNMMSYLPGGSPLLGEGQIRDWPGMVRTFARAEESGGPEPVRRIWDLMSADSRRVTMTCSQRGDVPQIDRQAILAGLNSCIQNPLLFKEEYCKGLNLNSEAVQLIALQKESRLFPRQSQRLNRLIVEATFPGIIIPTPRGNGILLANGNSEDPAVVDLMQGAGPGKKIGLHTMHLRTWWPSIRFWGLLALLFGFASVCIAVIVQPEWKRELLPYPMARFVQDMVEKGDKGFLPKVAQSRIFWYGFFLMIAIHLINGTYTWFPNFIHIPLSFDFNSLKTISTIFLPQIHVAILAPTLIPTVIAFTFFLNTQASFSVGISAFAYALVYTILYNNGISVSSFSFIPNNFPMMCFGSYVAMAIMIFYVGRRYYGNVIASGFGLKRNDETTSLSLWAFRVLLMCMAGIVLVLSLNGLYWVYSLTMAVLILLTFTVLARINAETGVLVIGVGWIPAVAICMIFGLSAIGPTSYIIMFIVAMVFTYDARETIMLFLTNAFYMATPRGKDTPPHSLVGILLVMVGLGFIVAFGVTMFLQYSHGVNYADSWASWGIPSNTMDRITEVISKLSSRDELTPIVSAVGFEKLRLMQPDTKLLGWMGIGMALVFGCSWMRMRFLWWPLHPVLFLVWGTWFPSLFLAPSILLGWIIKTIVMKFSGAQGYQTAKPFMIGVISGELIAGIFWMAVGAIYYFATGLIPKSYAIFPQ